MRRQGHADQHRHPQRCLRRVPCLLNGEADAQVICVDPALGSHSNPKLLTNACVAKFRADVAGRNANDLRHHRHRRTGRVTGALYTPPVLYLLMERLKKPRKRRFSSAQVPTE
jgi:hypothetical protein